MQPTEYLRRLRQLESRHNGTVPRHALELARCGDIARYRARRAATQSKFFDRFARNTQQAIQCRRAAAADPARCHALDDLAGDLRAARRQGLTWLPRRNNGGGIG